MGIYEKLKSALVKTSNKISAGIDHIFIKKRLDENTLEELEELLIMSDVGAVTSGEIINILRKHKFDKEVSPEEIKQDLAKIIQDMLDDHQQSLTLHEGLNVVIVCGVNGSGKTTTIGKMAQLHANQGKKVAIAACDTFRAAAVEQIEHWANKSGSLFFRGSEKADPASVAYNATIKSLENDVDILFIDTAGRLHNHNNLMQELQKIVRVVAKINPDFPHYNMLILDGTTGQNMSVQTEEFCKLIGVNSLVVTKLDGTSKGGALISLVKKHQLPVHYIGIGEQFDDLKLFSSEAFARVLVGI